MSMNTFAPFVAAPQPTALDATKHVNFTLGMVLGVDDLTQEFAYLAGHDQWLTREALGYGTLTGLQVTLTSDVAHGPGVLVAPGTAISPRGRLIRVPEAQAAALNDWIAAHAADVQSRIGAQAASPAASILRLYVVLSYRECPTDPVLVPGQPCRTEDESTVPSRRADDFSLELRFDPPEQIEETAIGRLVAWLTRVPVVDTAASTLDAFLNAIRAAAAPASPPAGFMASSPPANLRIPSTDLSRFLHAAFAVWATELRPTWRSAGIGPGQRPPDPGAPNAVADAESVLLAQLTVPLIRPSLTGPPTNWQVNPNGLAVDDRGRPALISLRLLQEWILAGGPLRAGPSAPGSPPGPSGTVTLAGDVTGPNSNATVARLSGVPVQTAGMRDGDVLAFVAAANAWRPRPLPLGGGTAGSPPTGGLPGAIASSIVAAGIIAADSTSGWVAGGLWSRVLRDGQIFISFDGYRDPTGATTYLVKAIPMYDLASIAGSAARTPIVTFDHFDFANHGMVLLVTDGSQPLAQNSLRQLQFMIEVSLVTGLVARVGTQP